MCPISCRFDTASTKCSVFIFVLSNISAYLCISVFIFILSNTSVYIQISVYRLQQYWTNSRQCGFQPTAVRKIRSLKAENEFNGSTEGDFFSHQLQTFFLILIFLQLCTAFLTIFPIFGSSEGGLYYYMYSLVYRPPSKKIWQW